MYTECSSATSVVMPSVSEPESSWTSHLHVPCHWRILNCTVPSRSTRHDSGRAVRRTTLIWQLDPPLRRHQWRVAPTAGGGAPSAVQWCLSRL